MGRKCKNNPDRFCSICGNVVLPDRQAKITDFVKEAYRNYIGVKLEDQDKTFAPHVCYKICVENLSDWQNCKKKEYAILMVWRGGKYQITDSHFCMIKE